MFYVGVKGSRNRGSAPWLTFGIVTALLITDPKKQTFSNRWDIVAAGRGDNTIKW